MKNSLQIPIIFTHYGYSEYLKHTLETCQYTNPTKDKIFIGDESNKAISIESGWKHHLLASVNSPLRAEFISCFKPVFGPKHKNKKNGGEWLKFVFERWFIIEAYCLENQIKEFWHFDSDVMILQPLDIFEERIKEKFSFTRQCNDSCLNGFVSTEVVTEYCKYIIELFKDEEFLLKQQEEFNDKNPTFAFTEMRAFDYFCKNGRNSYIGGKLESAIENWWFDDCLCQSDDFDTYNICLGGRKIKKVFFHKGHVYGVYNGKKIQMATLNLSWLPDRLFEIINPRYEVLKKVPFFISLKVYLWILKPLSLSYRFKFFKKFIKIKKKLLLKLFSKGK